MTIKRFYTKVFSKNIKAYLNDKKRLVVNQGGTSSSKTYSILQMLIEIAKRSSTRKLISICSESVPHLKRGVCRDFVNILGEEYDPGMHNKTDNVYDIRESQIEFFSADAPSKALGSRRDILFCNEVNNIRKDTFDQMEVRTKEKIIIDYNPVQEFWAHEILKDDDVEYIHSTFLDNDQLDERIVKSIMKRKDRDPNWWRVYGLGQVGSLEGLIFPIFKIIPDEEFPEDFKYERYGLDFGFSNHPSALIHCGIIGDKLYLNQLLHKTGLTNSDISNELEALKLRKGYDHIVADCAEPKSIKEISQEGWFVQPCTKGKDSIMHGITKVKQFIIHVTQSSLELIKELRNYQWKFDKINNVYINKPVDLWNHCLDAVRYAVQDYVMDELMIWTPGEAR